MKQRWFGALARADWVVEPELWSICTLDTRCLQYKPEYAFNVSSLVVTICQLLTEMVRFVSLLQELFL